MVGDDGERAEALPVVAAASTVITEFPGPEPVSGRTSDVIQALLGLYYGGAGAVIVDRPRISLPRRRNDLMK